MKARYYSHIAPHIRGRVYSMGPSSVPGMTKWGMQVINTRTGKVIADDDCTDYHKMPALADHAVAVARAAWFWSLRKSDLR